VGKEAFNTYFGYPSSTPPVYAKARGKARLKSAAKKSDRAKKRASRKRKKKASPPASGLTSPRRNAPVG
jgi:hypothetical protein